MAMIESGEPLDAPNAAESARLRSRLVALTGGAHALLAAVQTGSVRSAICDLAREVSDADAFAIWMLNVERGEWRIVHSVGLSESFAGQVLKGTTAPFADPLVADDLDSVPMLQYRRAEYHAEGICGLVSVPLPVGGERGATLVLYHRTPRRIAESEVQVAVALGHLAAAAIGHAESFEEERRLRNEAQRQAGRLAFLADSSSLFTSLDYETTLRQVAQMSVPLLSDWCAVDILIDGRLQRLATAHVDSAKVTYAEELLAKYPPDLSQDSGLGLVLRTGQPLLLAELTDEMIVSGARNPEHLASLRALSIKSVMMAPLNARGRTLGAITWVSSTPGRHFTEGDLSLLTDLSGRAALAIDNARLYEEAHQANRVKDEFLAVVSHELRTPLNTILGWSTMLLAEERDSATLRKALETIERNARTQAQLVDDLLNFARLGSSELEIARETLDVRGTVSALANEARPVAERLGLTLAVSLPAEPCTIEVDPQRVRQVLSNLLSNALKFSDRGGRVALLVESGPGQVEIRVSDTGVGIRPEFLPHVFDRFLQGDPSSTRRHGGLGLGLAIAKEFTERMGGSIVARSDGTGQGSTFVVTFPRVERPGEIRTAD
jgi:signal transduction histidine kinase